MEISGTIIEALPVQSGMGRNGTEWNKQEYVIQTNDQYPKKCCFGVWNGNIDLFGIHIGNDLDVSFNIDCREWNGKWFNDVRAYKVVQRNVAQSAPVQEPAQQSAPAELFNPNDSKDDLPF